MLEPLEMKAVPEKHANTTIKAALTQLQEHPSLLTIY